MFKGLSNSRSFFGLHIIGDLQKCNVEHLNNIKVDELRRTVSRLIRHYKLKELDSCYCQLSEGMSGIVLLTESHVSFHTWIKEGYVSLDVFVCNNKRDNCQETKRLFSDLSQLFSPGRIKRQEIKRSSA